MSQIRHPQVREVRDFSRKENENLAFSHGKAAGTGGKKKTPDGYPGFISEVLMWNGFEVPFGGG